MTESKEIKNPFPGLRPFETDEYRLFFGREGQSDALIARLQRSHFLAVVGTSGSGKSSLVRAGLFPALRGGLMAGAGSGWRIAIMRPGSDPIGNLANALADKDVLLEAGGGLPPAEAEAVIEATLRRGSLGLVEVARQARLGEHEKLLVVVDQFEELFRFRAARPPSSTGDDAAAFVKLLLEASQQQELSIYVVPTMRSDFLGDCAQFQGLPEAINDGQYLIPRMTRDERRFAITGPVGVTRGKISEPLVNRLMNDVGDNPDQLPILQHALMRTWDYWAMHRRDREPIGLEHYEAVGTMSDALSEHADEAFNELPDERSRVVAEILFKALTERGADNREIRRPTCLKDICEIAGATGSEVSAVIDVFRCGGRSFLMPPAGVELQPETVVDISHESLIRNWQRLKDWVNEEARSARIYRRLAEAAVLHREGSEGLLQDPALQIALDWREQSRPNAAWARRYHPDFEEALAYLETSRAARDAAVAEREHRFQEQIDRERRELEQAQLYASQQAASARRMRKLSWGMAVMFLLSLAIAVYALHARGDAKASERQTQAALQRSTLIRSGLEYLGRDNYTEALKSFDCLSRNLQALLPNAPKIPEAFESPCAQVSTSNMNEQLAVQLAWVYSKLGATNASIGDLDWSAADSNRKADATLHYSRALDAYGHAVAILKPLLKEDDPVMLNAYHGLAHASLSVAQTGYKSQEGIEKNEPEVYYKNAEHLFLLLLDIQNRRVDQEPSSAAIEHLNLAHLYRDMGKDVEAEKHFKTAAELWQKAGELSEVARADTPGEDAGNQEVLVLRELAEFYSNQERLDKAEEAYDQIIDIQENYDLSRGRDISDSYSELGQIYQGQGNGEKADTAFRLANLMQQAALKYKRNEFIPLSSDMRELAPLYSTLGRYVQVQQAYELALEFDRTLGGKTGEAEATLNQALNTMAATRIANYPTIWEEEDHLYGTLLKLSGPEKSGQLCDRRLANMTKRYREFIRQPGAASSDPPFLMNYVMAATEVGEFYRMSKNKDQQAAAYRLAFNFLPAVSRSTDLTLFSYYRELLSNYQWLLQDMKKPDEAAKVAEAGKVIEARQQQIKPPA
jgi:tetratricopeptide (TPR) repeat protein